MGRMSFGSPLVKIDLVDASNSNITGGSFTDDMVVGSILSNTSIPRNNDVREGFFSSIYFPPSLFKKI